jgi:DNA processing protein
VTSEIAVLEPGDPGYPERLIIASGATGIARRLYVRGSLGDGPAIAIVGARAASARGMERASMLARHFAERGVRVVSGGALGIDGAAHRGAGPGATTVVLGSGVDVAYPQRHASMFDAIAKSGGALVSVLPLGTEPRPHTFPQRNPIIAALADAVIVVEADVRSGSLSTAAAGKQLGRVIVAWPGSRGCDRLIASGAGVVESTDDAEAALAGCPRKPVPRALSPDEALVAEAIARGARDVEAIVCYTGLSVRAVLRALPLFENARKK